MTVYYVYNFLLVLLANVVFVMLYYVWLKLCKFIFLKLYFFYYNFPCSLIFGVVNTSLSPPIHIILKP